MATEEIDLRQWMVAVTAGGMKYLGKYDQSKKDGSNRFTLTIAFEFYTPVRIEPGGQVKRDAQVLPLDFVFHGVPLYVEAVSFYFCSELQAADQDAYRKMIRGGLDHMTRARAAMSGLTIAGPEARMPALK